MNNKQKIIVLIATILTSIFGFVAMIVFKDLEGVYRVFPYVMIGVGCGISGGIGGELLSSRAKKKNPEQAELISIEQNDERNIMIKHKAKSKVLDTITWLLAPMYIGLAFVENGVIGIFLLITLHVLGVFYMSFLISKYNKEM